MADATITEEPRVRLFGFRNKPLFFLQTGQSLLAFRRVGFSLGSGREKLSAKRGGKQHGPNAIGSTRQKSVGRRSGWRDHHDHRVGGASRTWPANHRRGQRRDHDGAKFYRRIPGAACGQRSSAAVIRVDGDELTGCSWGRVSRPDDGKGPLRPQSEEGPSLPTRARSGAPNTIELMADG